VQENVVWDTKGQICKCIKIRSLLITSHCSPSDLSQKIIKTIDCHLPVKSVRSTSTEQNEMLKIMANCSEVRYHKNLQARFFFLCFEIIVTELDFFVVCMFQYSSYIPVTKTRKAVG